MSRLPIQYRNSSPQCGPGSRTGMEFMHEKTSSIKEMTVIPVDPSHVPLWKICSLLNPLAKTLIGGRYATQARTSTGSRGDQRL